MHLSKSNTEPDPFLQFSKWYTERIKTVTDYPDAMSLATSSGDGKVSVRIVLLKEVDKNAFVFYTNYNSKKSKQLMQNPFAALLFFWPESGRQVRIEGYAEKVSDEDSDNYFETRPLESRLGSWASNQSEVISGRDYLNKRFSYFTGLYNNKVIRPHHWGGGRLIPQSFEFGKEGKFRLNDRILNTWKENTWKKDCLAP